jgi:hypothetical protein
MKKDKDVSGKEEEHVGGTDVANIVWRRRRRRTDVLIFARHQSSVELKHPCKCRSWPLEDRPRLKVKTVQRF